MEFIATDVTYDDVSIKVYGRTETGESVCARTNTFRPYLYVETDTPINPEQLSTRLALATKSWNKKEERTLYVKSVESVMRIPMMGYRPNGAIPMQKITLESPYLMSACQRIYEQQDMATNEANIKFNERFMQDRGFGGMDWVEVFDYWRPVERHTTCDIEIEFTDTDIRKSSSGRSDMGCFRILSFDNEMCRGGNGRGFVTAKEDDVSQIGFTLFDSTYKVLDKRCLSLGGRVSKLKDDVQVDVHPTEKALFLAFRDYIVKNDPDVITGYNIRTFDFPYMFERADALGFLDEFALFTREIGRLAKCKRASFASAARGARLDYDIIMEGRFEFDMLKMQKETDKLRSYSLGNVAYEKLGFTKVEMPYHLIPVYHNGTDQQRAHLCYYCWWDAHLCYELMKKQMVVVNYVESARVCGVPMSYFLNRGQQVLSHMLTTRFANRRNFVVPSQTENQNDEETDGATVLEPMIGLYTTPVVTLDFRSLYPSIIDDMNVCYTTKVPLVWARAHLRPDEYEVPPPTIKDPNYCFVTAKVQQGILPQIEQTLFDERNKAKAEMAKETDPFKKSVFDKRQNAIKTRMNSLYGFLKGNMVCDKDLMEMVTGVGRHMINRCKELVERTFTGSKVVYGDSVTGDTPILYRIGTSGSLLYANIEDVPRSSDWIPYLGEKEYAVPVDGLMVWSDQGFTRLNRIIRHRTDKDIFRILTHTGCVKVTSDHSLLLPNGSEIRPIDVTIGTELMHQYLPLSDIVPTNMILNCPYAMGLFYGDGSCGRYTWAINNTNKEYLEKAMRELDAAYPQFTFHILDTLESSGVYKLVPVGDNRDLVDDWRSLFYSKRKQKMIPIDILNAPIEVVTRFMEGYYAADGDKDINGYFRFDNKGQLGAAGLLFLTQRLGFKTSINTRKDKLDIYRITGTMVPQKRKSNAIKRIENLGPINEFVYDFETENHHFAAGVGQMVVHNTDSIFINFGNVTVEEAFRLGQEAATLCTKMFTEGRPRAVHLLQREKLFLPYLLCGKKKYAGNKCLGPGKPFEISASGMENVRRDSALLTSDIMDRAQEMIILEGDYTGQRTVAYVREELYKLKMGYTPIHKLIITKNLSKTFADYEKSGTLQPHVQLAKKIEARAHETGESKYYTGDRVPFVMVKLFKDAKKSDQAEDPLFALQNRLPLDVDYYAMNQIIRPLLRLLTPVIAPHERLKKLVNVKTGKKIEDETEAKNPITKYFGGGGTQKKAKVEKEEPVYVKKDLSDGEVKKLTVYKMLQYGDHMHHLVQKSSDRVSWVEKELRCNGCGVPMALDSNEIGELRMCSDCTIHKGPVLYLQEQRRMAALQEEHRSCWTTCQNCTKQHFAPIECNNRDCVIFYQRQKVLLDLEDLK